MTPSPPAPLHVTVFSFNRGEFLAHCVDSIRRCAPWARLTVFDDDSDDPHTRAVLDDVASLASVRTPSDVDPDDGTDTGRGPGSGPGPGPGKHGGLYANMQAAFDELHDDEVFCFLQDDMQLVRRLDRTEMDGLRRLVADPASPRLAHPPFLKGCNRRSDGPLIRFDPALDAYLVDRFRRSAGAFYSDVCLGHAGTLRACGWSFVGRESNNERQARGRLGQMAHLRHPFVAWLPNAPAYRGKTRTLALRIAEARRGCGFHPLRIMDESERTDFLARDVTVRPFAEDFLRPEGAPVPEPWIYYPLQGVRPLKWLNAAEIRLRRLLPRTSGPSAS